jgi:hypothetical protein
MTETPQQDSTSKIVEILLGLLSSMPPTSQHSVSYPERHARSLIQRYSVTAATSSAGLAIPPGPFGLLTVLPDLALIWRIQQQLVVDIASTFGRQSSLTREQMIYCLFRHTAAQVVRDLVVRVGERVLVKRASLRFLQALLEKIGIRVTQRVAGRVISRWVPVIGAVGMGAYSYFDTKKVGETALELFRCEIEIDGHVILEDDSSGKALAAR